MLRKGWPATRSDPSPKQAICSLKKSTIIAPEIGDTMREVLLKGLQARRHRAICFPENTIYLSKIKGAIFRHIHSLELFSFRTRFPHQNDNACGHAVAS